MSEVSSRKFPKEFQHGLVVSHGGFLRRIKESKMALNSASLDPCPPLVSLRMPAHATISRAIATWGRAVSCVFGVSRVPQIAAAIVKDATIDMVRIHSLWGAGNHSMHANGCAPRRLDGAYRPHGVPGCSEMPLMAQDAWSIHVVNKRHSALGQEDKRDTIVAHSVTPSLIAMPGVFAAPPGFSVQLSHMTAHLSRGGGA